MIITSSASLVVSGEFAVVVSPSRLSRFRGCSTALVGLLLALGAAGCADVVTFSRESREKGMDAYTAGNFVDAAGDFKNAIRQNPADYHSRYYLATCYAKESAYQQAVEQYQTCLGVMEHSLEGQTDKPFRLKVLDGLGQSLAKADDHTTATVASFHPGEKKAEDFFVAAKVNRYSGDADGAIEAYSQAALLDPSDFDIAKEFGLYAAQLQQRQIAQPQLVRAYTINDKDEQVQSALRGLGVVPGPGLKDEKALAKPLIPEGPIPKVDLTKLHLQNPFVSAPEASTAAGAGATSADQPPRD